MPVNKLIMKPVKLMLKWKLPILLQLQFRRMLRLNRKIPFENLFERGITLVATSNIIVRAFGRSIDFTSDTTTSIRDMKLVIAARDDAASFVATEGRIRGAQIVEEREVRRDDRLVERRAPHRHDQIARHSALQRAHSSSRRRSAAAPGDTRAARLPSGVRPCPALSADAAAAL